MIELRGVTKSFRTRTGAVHALAGVDLHVVRGEIMGVIGPSGAGKSTLIRCMNLLEQPDSGSVWLDGLNLTGVSGQRLRDARRQIGMVFQSYNLLSSATVAGNVSFPLSLAGVPRSHIRGRVGELLNLVELSEKALSFPAQLSGGQRQRVGIARALANHPKVLLCDEPTSALDPATTRSILNLLLRINRQLGLTVVIVTHEMSVVKEICDRVAILEQGRVVEVGPVLDVYATPKSRTAEAFLAAEWGAELPPEILSLMAAQRAAGAAGVLARLTFIGRAAQEPIMSQLATRFGVTANILYGGLDRIKGSLVGRLVVELSGERAAVEKALNYLAARKVSVEVLNDYADAAD